MYTENNSSNSNPARTRLILSGILDLVIALFFATLIAFTLFYVLAPVLGAEPKDTQGFNHNYDIVVAQFFGGAKELATLILFGVALAFLVGLIFSFPYVKSCFFLARANLSKVKEKAKTLTLNATMQIILGIMSLAIAISTMIQVNDLGAAKSTVLLGIIVGTAFIITGSIKASCIKLIKTAQVTLTNTYNKNMNNYYHLFPHSPQHYFYHNTTQDYDHKKRRY